MVSMHILVQQYVTENFEAFAELSFWWCPVCNRTQVFKAMLES